MSAAPTGASIAREHITGAVLAGGRGQRMQGADKGLVPLHDKPLVAHVLARLEPQVGMTVINANRNIDRYATFGHPVVLDEIGDFAGPLAGVHAVLAYATTRYVVTCPCDVPRLPLDLVARLSSALAEQHVDVAGGAHGRAAGTGVRALRPHRAARPSPRTCAAASARSRHGRQACAV